jgi:hypothetical protein
MSAFKSNVFLVPCAALGLILISPQNGSARCDPLRPSTCIPSRVRDGFQNGTSEGFFRFNVLNKCNDYIDVTVGYYDHPFGDWRKRTWVLSPGERAYLFDTANRNVSLSAKSSRNSSQQRSWNERNVNMGSVFTDWTSNLTCN